MEVLDHKPINCIDRVCRGCHPGHTVTCRSAGCILKNKQWKHETVGWLCSIYDGQVLTIKEWVSMTGQSKTARRLKQEVVEYYFVGVVVILILVKLNSSVD